MAQTAAHLKLAEELRARIESQELKPGYRFPPTRELAAEWHTYPLAVHNAFKILVKAGLVERQHRHGTFVRRSLPVLGSVAIYLGDDIMHRDHSQFACTLYRELRRQLQAEGVRVETLLDPRQGDDKFTTWATLVKLFERQEAQALIALAANAEQMDWIRPLPVTQVNLQDTCMPYAELVRLGVEALARQGCRSVGAITTLDDRVGQWSAFHTALAQQAAVQGLEYRAAWDLSPQGWFENQPGLERYAYEQMLALWRQPRRPEGLLVFPDNLIPGILAGMQRLHLRAPDDLCLALHKNREIDVICPFPATFIVYPVATVAAALLRQLRRKLAGEIPEPETIPFTVEENIPNEVPEPVFV